MIWAMIPDWLKKTAAAALAVFLCLAAGYAAGTIQERQRIALAVAKATARANERRADINEKVINMDARMLCLELGGVREQCDELRGLATDKR